MGTLALITINFFAADRSLSLTCPGLAESNSQLTHISAGQYLKFCDDKPSVAMLSTLNDSQDLDSDYWRPVFRFNELSKNCIFELKIG